MGTYNEVGVKYKGFTPSQGNFFMSSGKKGSRGKRLQAWMDAHGYGEWGGQSLFAKTCGIKQQQLSRYLGDESEPSSEVRLRLASIGVNLHWLDTGEGPMDAPDPKKRVYPSEIGSMGKIVGEATGHWIEIDGRRVLVIDDPELPDDSPSETSDPRSAKR